MALITRAGLARLDKALAWIDEHPEQHDQTVWMKRTDCGTAMCIAGVLVMLAGGTPAWGADGHDGTADAVLPNGTVVFIPVCAAILLEMNYDEAYFRIFSSSNTRKALQREREFLAESL